MKLPNRFCNQLRYILVDSIGEFERPGRLGTLRRAQWHGGLQPISNILWYEVFEQLDRELGLPPLKGRDNDNNRLDLFMQYVETEEVSEALYAIEMVFNYLESLKQPRPGAPMFDEFLRTWKLPPDAALEKLNEIFSRNALNYKYEVGKIVETANGVINA